MKINKALLAGLLMMALGSSAMAQENGEEVKNVFNPHWYVQAQPLGMQYTLGENPFGKLLSYNVQVAGGYNFNKYLGARFAINAFQSKGGWDMDVNKNWKWYYIAPAVDVTLDLSNLMFGYNPDRLFTFGVFAGIGANVAWGNKEAATVKSELTSIYGHDNALRYLWDGGKASFLGRAGIMGDFNIDQHWSVGLELQATTLSDKYNSKKAGNTDWYFNGLIGVKYVFGNKNTKQAAPAKLQEAAPLTDSQVNVVEKVIEKTIYVETTIHEISRSIYFKHAGNTTISASEMVKVQEVADFMKDHPDATVTLCGYADKGTGNPTINAKLSEKRVKAVADALMNKYGIEESRITVDFKGDSEQPKEGTANRVTIAVAKSKKVVEVVK